MIETNKHIEHNNGPKQIISSLQKIKRALGRILLASNITRGDGKYAIGLTPSADRFALGLIKAKTTQGGVALSPIQTKQYIPQGKWGITALQLINTQTGQGKPLSLFSGTSTQQGRSPIQLGAIIGANQKGNGSLQLGALFMAEQRGDFCMQWGALLGIATQTGSCNIQGGSLRIAEQTGEFCMQGGAVFIASQTGYATMQVGALLGANQKGAKQSQLGSLIGTKKIDDQSYNQRDVREDM